MLFTQVCCLSPSSISLATPPPKKLQIFLNPMTQQGRGRVGTCQIEAEGLQRGEMFLGAASHQLGGFGERYELTTEFEAEPRLPEGFALF